MFMYDLLSDGKPLTTMPTTRAVCGQTSDLEYIFNLVGRAFVLDPNETLINTTPHGRIAIAIIAAPALLKRWLDDQGTCSLRKLGINMWGKNFLANESVIELRTLAPFLDYWNWLRDDPEFVNLESWNSSTKLDKFMEEGDFLGWAAKAQATDRNFAELKALAEVAGGDVHKMDEIIGRKIENDGNTDWYRAGKTSFLVRGLIPRGAVTLLLGNRKVGKSALGLELAVTTARREAEWAGFNLTPGAGYAAYLAGEDTPQETLARVHQMTSGDMPYTLWVDGSSDLKTILQKLRGERIALLVVDPARKYFHGDEDGSDAVSAFFTQLEDFAREKNCAVVVTHHLKRYASVKSVHDVANHYRGSGVFLDRPRVTLAVHRSGNETHLAIPVLDRTPLHNFRQSDMFAGVRRLRRDEKSFRHVVIDVQQSSTAKLADHADTERVLAVARGAIESGERLTRTGKTGLYERRLPALAGMPRTTVRSIVDALTDDGRLAVDGAGVLTLLAHEDHADHMPLRLAS